MENRPLWGGRLMVLENEAAFVFNNQYFSMNTNIYIFNTLHTSIPRGYCASQLQQVLLTVTSKYGSGLILAIQYKRGQGVTLRQSNKKRRVFQ